MPTDVYRQVTSVDSDVTFFTAREAVGQLRETEGILVSAVSVSGEYPRPHDPFYAATKLDARIRPHLAGVVGEDGVGIATTNATEVPTEFGFEDGDALAEALDSDEAAAPEDVTEAIAFAARRDSPNVVHEGDETANNGHLTVNQQKLHVNEYA